VIVYQSTKDGFLDDVFKRDIEEVILSSFKARTGRTVAQSEVRSWKESLFAMAKVLNGCSIPGDAGVGVELFILQTAKRIDFLLTGKNAAERDQLLIVELKQWKTAQKTGRDGVVRTRFASGEADTNHPSYQAWSYASLLTNFNEAVYESDLELRPCAYLHNYEGAGDITDAFYAEHLARAPVFLRGDAERRRFCEFLGNHVQYGDRDSIIFQVDNGRIRPSKGLVESLVGMLEGRQEFVLVDDQKVVFETALEIAREAAETGKKQVVIVEGGPGTGKSVVAINLLARLTECALVTKYVTKNRAPRQVFERVLTGTKTKTEISNLFASSGEFTATPADSFGALVVDEAHRLNEKSGLFAKGTHQVDEIIRAAKCAIFFIDEDQRVTWKDIGEKRDIEQRARRAGIEPVLMQLASQFRCSGSDGYLAWLDDTLGIKETANTELDVSAFDFQVLDSPEDMRSQIAEKNAPNNKARMVAGYCWDWKSRKDGRALDVVIPEHGFGMQWNLAEDQGLWIIERDSVKQIGCIHTCQGLEVDYIGVIVGPDLVVRDGKVVTQPTMRSKHDKSLSGYKKLRKIDPEAAEEKAALLIKNTYRTLMTRGLKGCYVYCTDGETGEYLKSRLTGC
jgi:uncharacterized protein